MLETYRLTSNVLLLTITCVRIKNFNTVATCLITYLITLTQLTFKKPLHIQDPLIMYLNHLVKNFLKENAVIRCFVSEWT